MMDRYDVILYNSTRKFGNFSYEHLGLGYLASSLRKNGYKVKIIDSYLESLSPEEAVSKLSEYDFNILGVSFLSYSWEQTKVFVSLMKKVKPQIKIIAGGHFVSFVFKNILNDMPEIDYILLGECEFTLPKLVDSIYNNSALENLNGLYSRDLFNSDNSVITDLDKLEFPARDYLPIVLNKGGTAAISTSRGCYGSCSFCSVQKFYENYSIHKWRYRSPENILEEIQFLVKSYNIDFIDFQDDNFISGNKFGLDRANHLAKIIKESNIQCSFRFDLRVNDVSRDLLLQWKEVGLREVLIGIESIDEDDLKFYNKNITPKQVVDAIGTLDSIGLKYKLSTILFNPYSSIESINKNLTFLKKINYIDPTITSILNVYEGTPVCNKLKKENILKGPYYNYSWQFLDSKTQEYFNICIQYIKKTLSIKKLLTAMSNNVFNDVYEVNQNFMFELSEKFFYNVEYYSTLDKMDQLISKYMRIIREHVIKN